MKTAASAEQKPPSKKSSARVVVIAATPCARSTLDVLMEISIPVAVVYLVNVVLRLILAR